VDAFSLPSPQAVAPRASPWQRMQRWRWHEMREKLAYRYFCWRRGLLAVLQRPAKAAHRASPALRGVELSEHSEPECLTDDVAQSQSNRASAYVAANSKGHCCVFRQRSDGSVRLHRQTRHDSRFMLCGLARITAVWLSRCLGQQGLVELNPAATCRQDTWSDLQLVLVVNLTVITLFGWIKSSVVDALDTTAPRAGPKPFWLSIYEARAPPAAAGRARRAAQGPRPCRNGHRSHHEMICFC